MRYTYNEIKNTDEFGSSWWSYIIKPFIYKLTFWFANYTRFTPNQITIISLIFGLLSAYSFLNGTSYYLIMGAFLYEISFILDCVDGRIARLKDQKSVFGAYIDIMSDFTKYSLIIICLIYGQYILTKDISLFLYGYIFLSLEIVSMTQTYIIGHGAKNKKNADDNINILKDRFPILTRIKLYIDPENKLTFLPIAGIETETIVFFIFPILMNIKLGMIVGSIILVVYILILIFYNFLIKNERKVGR